MQAVHSGGCRGGGSIPGHNYLELRFTGNSTQLWHLHVPVNRGTKEKGLYEAVFGSKLSGSHLTQTLVLI